MEDTIVERLNEIGKLQNKMTEDLKKAYELVKNLKNDKKYNDEVYILISRYNIEQNVIIGIFTQLKYVQQALKENVEAFEKHNPDYHIKTANFRYILFVNNYNDDIFQIRWMKFTLNRYHIYKNANFIESEENEDATV